MGVISFKDGYSSTDIATLPTLVSQPVQPSGNKYAGNGANMTIYVNRSPNVWWVDSTLIQNKGVGKSDFFCVMLHELGHSLGLVHSYDSAAPNSDYLIELMSKINYKGIDTVPAARRMTPTTGMSSAKHGVQRMVKDSYGIAWRDVANANPGQVGTLGNTTTPPVLTSNPLHQLVCLTTTTNFKVTTNTAGSYYQWKNADTGANLAGVSATTANYSTASTGAYNCLVSKNGCSTLSKTAVFEQMPKIYVTDSLHKCTNQPIEIYAPKFRSPLIFTATGTGVSMLNGRVMVKPSAITNNDQTQVDYKLTNPAQPAQTGQAAQAAQECTGYSGIRLLSNTIFTPDTRIKTCPPTTNCLHQSVNNISIPQFQIASLGCYKTGIHYILQLSNVGGTFPATSVTNIPNKIFDTTTVIKRQDFSLLIPKMMFPSTGLYKIRLVLYTPGAVPTISYSSNVCTFTVKVVQFFSQCALEDRPQVKYENIVDPPTLYPNPTADRFTLQTPEYDAATEVSISDAQGRMISQQNVYTTSNEIETHELPNGFYYVRVAQGERSTVLKLVILK
jgi:Secretion system C-terminal sorting domain